MVVARNRSNGVDYAKEEDMPAVFEAVNYLQNVPYRINRKVLEVIKQMRKANITCSSMPPAELEAIPPKPHDIDTNEEARTAYRKLAREAYGRNTAAKGKILSVAKTIAVAQRYAERERIYFPKCVDFRGRVYDIPMFLKPQGDDLSKGMLEFANGKPLGSDGAYWLAVHGANVWGEDKCSLDDRVAWVEANESRILRAADQPFEERFWMDADKPFQFLAFCFEWAGFCTDGEGHVSRLPVALDGSCNGLQHLSAMLRDPIGGAAVNLLPSDKPQDIYTEVMNKVLDELKERSAKGEPTAQRWIPLMKRKTVKRNVMTLPYGATRTGFADQIMEDTLRPLQRDGNCPFSEPYTAARYLGEIVWEATGLVVVAARVAMDWLQECAKIVAKEGYNVQWKTPSGFIVKQDYRKLKARKVELQAMGTRVQIQVAEGPGPKLDSRKMAASIAPNFVHSMDAAHMLNTVQLMTDTDKSLHFSMVHDSYATHAADTEVLSTLIRQSFVQLYLENNWLQSFKDQIEDQTGLELPEVPEYGGLELSEVLKSLYFFA
jgi:DNA-directed RNA polymerase